MKSFTTTIAPMALLISSVMAEKAYGGLDNESQNFKTMVAVHGALMAFCFAILFPVGAYLLRALRPATSVRVHSILQVITLLIALVGFAIGVWMVHHSHSPVSLWKAFNGHPVIGTIIITLLLIQPIGGALHHSMYKKRTLATTETATRGPSTPVGLVHRWLGRLLLIFGMINGGLGFQLAKESKVPIIVYSVICVLGAGLWAFGVFRKRRATGTRSEKMHSPPAVSA